MPGSAFLRTETELTVRLCYIDFCGQSAFEALETNRVKLDDEFVKNLAPRVYNGIKALKEFVIKYT